MALEVMTVVGARPQFIKAAMLSHEFARRSDVHEHLVHTGQHYDYGMSQLFFEELDIPAPEVNLGVSGGSHAQMTAGMLTAIEAEAQRLSPDVVVLYGDTNSTLAGALAAAKLNIPVAHVEAGFRTHFLTNPEEVNRVCVDHVSSVEFAPTDECMDELAKENLADRSIFSGDLMYDAYRFYVKKAQDMEVVLTTLGGQVASVPERYVYLTCHRQENDSPQTVHEVLAAMETLDIPAVYPVHPRMQKLVQEVAGENGFTNTLLAQPVGYLESLNLLSGSDAVVTDSGGLQREAFFATKKCATLLPFPAAEETLRDNRNTLVDPVTCEGILAAMGLPQHVDPRYLPFGDGHAARVIADVLVEKFSRRGA